jgi:hypothetical protein
MAKRVREGIGDKPQREGIGDKPYTLNPEP